MTSMSYDKCEPCVECKKIYIQCGTGNSKIILTCKVTGDTLEVNKCVKDVKI